MTNAPTCEDLPEYDEQEVDADIFFGVIATRFMTRFRLSGTPVSIHVDAQIVDIPVNLAADLGCMATELLNNACTHGRSADGSATAWLSFHIHRNLVHLDVEDDGPGWCEGFDLERIGTGGLGQVNMLVQDLSGVTRSMKPKGARVVIRIPQPAHQGGRGTPGFARDDLRARRNAKQRGR